MSPTGRALLLAAAVTSAACAPGVRVRGSVAEVGPTCSPEPSVPLSEARVAIHCPNRHEPLVEVLTDAEGRFELRREGILSKACWVRVSKPNRGAVIYPLGPLCAVEGTVLEGCHGFALQAELPRPVDEASPGEEASEASDGDADDADDDGT